MAAAPGPSGTPQTPKRHVEMPAAHRVAFSQPEEKGDAAAKKLYPVTPVPGGEDGRPRSSRVKKRRIPYNEVETGEEDEEENGDDDSGIEPVVREEKRKKKKKSAVDYINYDGGAGLGDEDLVQWSDMSCTTCKEGDGGVYHDADVLHKHMKKEHGLTKGFKVKEPFFPLISTVFLIWFSPPVCRLHQGGAPLHLPRVLQDDHRRKEASGEPPVALPPGQVGQGPRGPEGGEGHRGHGADSQQGSHVQAVQGVVGVHARHCLREGHRPAETRQEICAEAAAAPAAALQRCYRCCRCTGISSSRRP